MINNGLITQNLVRTNGLDYNNVNQANKPNTNETKDFNKVFENIQNQNTSTINFSKHAANRLNDRDINLSKEQISRVEKGLGDARQKGINSGLVLVDNIALVVSLKNNTVITAVNEKENKVFTNIDGAIIV